jgi:hypothetical protein
MRIKFDQYQGLNNALNLKQGKTLTQVKRPTFIRGAGAAQTKKST